MKHSLLTACMFAVLLGVFGYPSSGMSELNIQLNHSQHMQSYYGGGGSNNASICTASYSKNTLSIPCIANTSALGTTYYTATCTGSLQAGKKCTFSSVKQTTSISSTGTCTATYSNSGLSIPCINTKAISGTGSYSAVCSGTLAKSSSCSFSSVTPK